MWLACLGVHLDRRANREIHLNMNVSKNIQTAFPADFSTKN